MANDWYSNHSQIYWTCKALVQGRTITHMDEIGEIRGWRLGAIIHNLHRHYHWPIQTEYQGAKRIADYKLKRDTNWRALEFPQSARKLKDDLSTQPQNGPDAPQGAYKGRSGCTDG